MTPDEFERLYGISAKRLRGYLRKRWPHYRYDLWELNAEMVADAGTKFGVGSPPTASVALPSASPSTASIATPPC